MAAAGAGGALAHSSLAAFLRAIPFFILTPLLALALVYLFNLLLFGGEWSLTWVVIGLLPALIALVGVLATPANL